MEYLVNRNGRYYYNRRIPLELREHDPRKLVRIALKTDSRKQAVKLAAIQNSKLELYWQQLLQTGSKYSHTQYEATVERAGLFGFTYKTNEAIALAPLHEIGSRLKAVEAANFKSAQVEAIVGGLSLPTIKLDEALIRFWEYSKSKTFNKSPNQLRKWKHPRKRAVDNFIKVIGNKPVTEISRDDILTFRDWWLGRIQNEAMSVNSANKNFIQLKSIMKTVNDNLKLNIDISFLFSEIVLPEDQEQTRQPFTTDYIVETLLNAERLSGLNEQAKEALRAFAETGAGPSELVGLRPDEIILNSEIPHIIIKPRQFYGLKTKYRKRIIPLVGHALEAFKKFPQGFTEYYDAPDRLSAVLGKFLREKNLLPSNQHTVYSLRHSFQDRLLAANTPDRVQSDLMGHKFNRQAYGNGASLEQKLEYLEKIKLRQT